MSEHYVLKTELLNKIIQDNDYKLDWLASELGVSKMTINRWTKGKTIYIRKAHLHALAKALNCKEVNDLIIKDKPHAGMLRVYGEKEFLENILKIPVDKEFSCKEVIEFYYYLASRCYKNGSLQIADHYVRNVRVLALRFNVDFEMSVAKLRGDTDELELELAHWLADMRQSNKMVGFFVTLHEFFKVSKLHHLDEI